MNRGQLRKELTTRSTFLRFGLFHNLHFINAILLRMFTRGLIATSSSAFTNSVSGVEWGIDV